MNVLKVHKFWLDSFFFGNKHFNLQKCIRITSGTALRHHHITPAPPTLVNPLVCLSIIHYSIHACFACAL